jgi:hypothetical protein
LRVTVNEKGELVPLTPTPGAAGSSQSGSMTAPSFYRKPSKNDLLRGSDLPHNL